MKTRISILFGFVLSAAAQVNYTGGTYIQNFDSLSSGVVYRNNTNLPAGWILTRGSYVWTTVTNGYSNNYGTYCFSSETNDPNKSIGLVIGTTGPASVGAHFRNETGVTLSSFSISYIVKQWARGAVINSNQIIPFSYSLNATSLTNGTFVSVPVLNMQSIHDGNGTFAALNGNDPANRQLITGAVSGITWLPNQELWIRWTGVSHPFNSSHALALDDLTFTAVPDVQISAENPGQLRISWPTNFSDFTLQSATTLPATSWEIVTETPTISSGTFTIQIELTDSQRYFQLKLQ